MTVLALFLSLGFGARVKPELTSDKVIESHTIAVLPYKMIFTGTLPKNVTEELKIKIETIESMAFQESLYKMLISKSKKVGRTHRLVFQPITTTNQILKDNGISIHQSWEMEPQELAKVLKVDAVVQSYIEKREFFSDGNKLKLMKSRPIFTMDWYSETNTEPSPPPPALFFKAKCKLIDGNDGSILLSLEFSESNYWFYSPQIAIDEINRAFAVKFRAR